MKKIITDADLDGLISAAILRTQLGIDVSKIDFANPKVAQHGEVILDGETIVVDLPYIPRASMWYDHHKRNIFDAPAEAKAIPGLRKEAPSCARVIADHYGITDLQELLVEADRIDSGKLTAEDITSPSGYMLLSYLVKDDAKNREFMNFNRHIISLIRDQEIIDILEDKQVDLESERYKSNLEKVRSYMTNLINTQGNVVVLDMRNADDPDYIDPAFKFMQYGLSPESNVSVRIYHPNLDRSQVRFQVGWSIFTKGCKTDIAETLSPLGGGGHKAAGGVTVNSQDADKTYQIIMKSLVE